MIRTSRAIPALLALLLTGCTINRDIMFKTEKGHTFDTFVDSTEVEARIRPNDVLEFRLFANDGFKMIDLVSEGGANEMRFMNRMIFTYTVEYDGLVKLPLLGRTPISGLSVREAEMALEERYQVYYHRPYVQLRVVNRRVVVYTGEGGSARVVTLDNNNTTLLEVLGMAGGLAERGDARKVKLFRLDRATGKRRIYQFDMSDIDGVRYADIVMQGDDVVYVQPNPDLAREALQDLTPIIGLLTSVVLIVTLIQSLQ